MNTNKKIFNKVHTSKWNIVIKRKMPIDEGLDAVKFQVTMQIFMSNRKANYF